MTVVAESRVGRYTPVMLYEVFYLGVGHSSSKFTGTDVTDMEMLNPMLCCMMLYNI